VPTGFLDEKYRIHPIYSICLFLDVRNKNSYGAVIQAQTPLKHILSGYVMADLLLQDFRDLFSRNLVQVLFTEKTKMFGEEKFHAKKREDNWLGSRPLGDPMLTSEKSGGRNVRK